MTEIPKDVLDFSSGSDTSGEEVQGLKKNQSGDDKSGKASTGPRPMCLLQHGFSRLLARVKEKLEPDEGGSGSCTKDSSFEEDIEDQNVADVSSAICTTSTAGNGVVCLPKSETKTQDKSTGSDRKQENNGSEVSLLKEEDYATSRKQGQKRWMSKQTAADDESNENASPENKTANKLKSTFPKTHHFDAYSDESEDLDLEVKTCSKTSFNLDKGGGGGGQGKLCHNKRRHKASVRNGGRAKYTEDIETFTSSEDEQPAGIPKAVSFTNLKSQKSPVSKARKQSIDSVLGQSQYFKYVKGVKRGTPTLMLCIFV